MNLRTLLLPLLSIACGEMFGADAERITYFDCDFNNGLPESASFYDNDGLELHFTMTQRGFDSTDSWIRMREEGTENYFAASASRFKSADTQNPPSASDWMVFNNIWIRGNHATLRWKSRSFNEQSNRPSSYSVYVSTKGPSPESFTGQPIATVTENEMDKWSEHSADLSAFAGQHLYVAFVNNTANGEILGIDDISIDGEKGIAEITVSPGEYVLGTDKNFNIGGTLTACSDERITSFHSECDVAGETYTIDLTGLNLGSGESIDFSFPANISAEYGESVPFTVRAVVNTTEFDPIKTSTTLLAFLPKRNVVIEEVTGMWCQYCPKGLVAFDILAEKYPDSFIGISIHMGANADPLALDDYANQNTFPGGAPSGWIDRKTYSIDPMVPAWIDNKRSYTTLMGGFETLLLERLEQLPLAEVLCNVNLKDDNSFNLSVSSRFPIDMKDADLRLAVVITEDHVWKEGYYQNNRFSGGSEILAGYESRPNVIYTDMEFNHVARAIYDDYNGIPDSLPVDITAGTTYEYSRTFDIPVDILDIANVKVIAMIIDNSTGEILNATSSALVPTGIKETESSRQISIRHDVSDNSVVIISSDSAAEIKASLYSISGELLSVASGSTEVRISTGSYSGPAIIKIDTPEGTSTRKLLI